MEVELKISYRFDERVCQIIRLLNNLGTRLRNIQLVLWQRLKLCCAIDPVKEQEAIQSILSCLPYFSPV